MPVLTCPDDASSLTGSHEPAGARVAARLVLAAAAAGAGVIHLTYAPEHVREYLPLGIGFLVAGVLQLLWAASLTVRESPRLLLWGGLFSFLFIGAYLMSRTTGLPLVPGAFHPESVGTADLICCALEVPVAFGALLLRRRPSALRGRMHLRLAAVTAGSVLLIGLATTFALAASPHEHAPCPSAPVLTGVHDDRGVDTGVTAFFTCQLLHEHDGHHAGH